VGAEGGISRCVVVVAGAHFHAVVGVDVDVAGGVRARRAVLSEFWARAGEMGRRSERVLEVVWML